MFDGLLPWLPGFAAAYAIQAIGVASPGPGVAMLLGLALSQGRAPALAASLGIAVGAACLALATTQGLGLLMEQVAWLSTVIRVVGACYLMWLAINAWQRALTPPVIGIAPAVGAGGFARSFGIGLAMQLTNPKAIVFWLAVAAVGATQNAPTAVVALFVAGAFSISLLGHGTYAVLLSSRPFRLAYDRARRWIEAGVGGCLTWFAIRLATERN
ncbi:LysE family translocator [Pelagibacterium lentulum]|uniref:Amino acid transporter n=1 Tax=Pelagibacterium lentulum TaxID=2029865 RepID=A0A916RDM4_9HYPH|nr:LysE family translocator [Pelagibacterium lentulum]GGA52836.1 amino acid transporter [Pelagibacterium lentulum]